MQLILLLLFACLCFACFGMAFRGLSASGIPSKSISSCLGVAALLWSLCGLGISAMMAHHNLQERYSIGFMLWIYLGWLGPTFMLAISGLRRGPFFSRVCGALVLLIFAVWIYLELT
jgi:hypothetical protein